MHEISTERFTLYKDICQELQKQLLESLYRNDVVPTFYRKGIKNFYNIYNLRYISSGRNVGLCIDDDVNTDTLIYISKQNENYSSRYRVEIDLFVYFDSTELTREPFALHANTNKIIPLIQETLSSDDIESYMFQYSTIYSDKEQFSIWMDYYLRNVLHKDFYFYINFDVFEKYSTEIFEAILLELKNA